MAKYVPETDNFKYYQHNPNDVSTLSSNRIQAIYEDGSGTFWIGTYNGGINTLNIKTGEITTYRHSEEPHSLSSDIVLCIVEDSKGNIWVRTDRDIDVFDKESGSFSRLNSKSIAVGDLTPYYDGSLFAYAEGSLWATEKNHLLKINAETRKFDVLYFTDYVTDELQLLDIISMKDDFLWVSHINGVFLIDKRNLIPLPFYNIENKASRTLHAFGTRVVSTVFPKFTKLFYGRFETGYLDWYGLITGLLVVLNRIKKKAV